ncbi:MAG: hypothetical protein ACPF9F_02960 [Acholeplasmataceae bacterium]
MNISKQNKRDMLLVLVLLFIIGTVMGYREWIYEPGETTVANVYYGNASYPIVVIDFFNQEIIISNTQPNAAQYPKHNVDNQTITLLGDYEIDSIRQEVVLRYNFETKTVEIIEEESPYHVCSKQGESDGEALICLPNSIRVEFSTATQDFIL